jgi:TIR domain
VVTEARNVEGREGMSIFVERFVLAVFAAIFVANLMVNPLRMDWIQRVGVGLMCVGAAIFSARTIEKARAAAVPPAAADAPPPVPATPPKRDDALVARNDSEPAKSKSDAAKAAEGNKVRRTDKLDEDGDADTRDAFISYGYVDDRTVTATAEQLEKKYGLKVFLSKWDIRGGDPIWSKINESIDKCKTLVVFLSAKAVASPGVKKEVQLALQKSYEEEKNRRGWRLIPVFIDPLANVAEVVPVELRARNGIDFSSGRRTFHEKVHDLAQAIRGELPAREAKEQAHLDFFYRVYDVDSHTIIVEIGSGLPALTELGVGTEWTAPVTGTSWMRYDPPGLPKPRLGGIGGMFTELAGHYWPGPGTHLVIHRSDLKVDSTSSLYLMFNHPDGTKPKLTKVTLLDRNGTAVSTPELLK